MTIASYTDLQTAVADWLARSGDSIITARVADFIALFEDEIVGDPDFRYRWMEERDTASTTAGTQFLALPTGYIEQRTLRLLTDPVESLEYLPPKLFWDLYAASTQGKPKKYTVLDSELAFAPIPDSAYTVEMMYVAFSPLSTTNTTNWLLTRFPSVYLFGSLEQAAHYLDNDRLVAKFKAKKDEAIQKLAVSDWQAKYAGSALQMTTDTGNP